jgi:hypothetical protein
LSADRLAWVLRTVMVGAAAVTAYLLVQTDLVLDPAVRVALGALSVFLAAINPASIASRARPTSDE